MRVFLSHVINLRVTSNIIILSCFYIMLKSNFNLYRSILLFCSKKDKIYKIEFIMYVNCTSKSVNNTIIKH